VRDLRTEIPLRAALWAMMLNDVCVPARDQERFIGRFVVDHDELDGAVML
jgi:hypothetical protein